MTTNAMQPLPKGSQPNSDLQLIRSWLLQLSRFCDPLNEKDLREKIQCYSTELLDDVPVSAFTGSTLRAARKRFTKFPSYPKLLEVLPVYSGDGQDDRAESVAHQRANGLAYAAANHWLESRADDRLHAYNNGYASELSRWLVKEYFAKASAGMISGTFDAKEGYILNHVPPLSVPAWQIDAWVDREAEKRECRKAVAGKSGFKRLSFGIGENA